MVHPSPFPPRREEEVLMTGSIEQSLDHTIEARRLESSPAATPAERCLPMLSSPERGAIATQHHPPGVPRQVQDIPRILAFLVDRGHLCLTTEHVEAWQPLRETWTEAQKNQDDPDVKEFRHDVARIYDRAVKRAVHPFGNGPGGIGRLKGNLERYR